MVRSSDRQAGGTLPPSNGLLIARRSPNQRGPRPFADSRPRVPPDRTRIVRRPHQPEARHQVGAKEKLGLVPRHPSHAVRTARHRGDSKAGRSPTSGDFAAEWTTIVMLLHSASFLTLLTRISGRSSRLCAIRVKHRWPNEPNGSGHGINPKRAARRSPVRCGAAMVQSSYLEFHSGRHEFRSVPP